MSVRERAHKTIADLWDEAAEVYASRLTYVESRAALAARGRASRRHRRQLAQAKIELEDRWETVAIVELNELVREVAALAAERHRLRGADAVHLASAAVLGSGVTMVTRDGALRRASLAAGLDVAP
ncbi:MAG: PIN domain-containing protein [Actinobacteria bacterium]|nr:PIN domain-containing protein [Actinomycetota bacterium]